MPTSQAEVVAIPLHPEATALAKTYVDTFAVSLVFQAKVLAYVLRDDVVLRRHVRIAQDILRRQEDDGSWWKEAVMLFGGGAFSVGLVEFLRDVLSSTPGIPAIIGWVGTMLVGMFLVFWQMRR